MPQKDKHESEKKLLNQPFTIALNINGSGELQPTVELHEGVSIKQAGELPLEEIYRKEKVSTAKSLKVAKAYSDVMSRIQDQSYGEHWPEEVAKQVYDLKQQIKTAIKNDGKFDEKEERDISASAAKIIPAQGHDKSSGHGGRK